jgi:hypothetical protein
MMPAVDQTNSLVQTLDERDSLGCVTKLVAPQLRRLKPVLPTSGHTFKEVQTNSYGRARRLMLRDDQHNSRSLSVFVIAAEFATNEDFRFSYL